MHSTAKSAIVTGSSRGIGAAIAERLARDGFHVAINFSGNVDAAQALVAKLQSGGGRAILAQADVSDAKAVAAMFDLVEREFGGVDVLVNNAGIMRLSTIADADEDSFDRHVAINLKGVFNGCREAARRLRDGGRIVNFSSSVVGLYQPTYGIYAATKAGVEALTHVLSKELGKRGITVNAVAPGPTATDLFLQDKSNELIARIAALAPLGRLGEPDDIARTVSFLVGPDGGWINGQVLRANGGVV
jgi:3-oxoacyl-[acyl-carrier protein] reductase